MTTMTMHKQGDPSNATLQVSPPDNRSVSTIKDTLGRVISIQEPSILQESRLVRSLGEAASNAAYMTAYALPAAMVTKIDDYDVIFPVSQVHLDILMGLLGREGMGAVMDHLIASAKVAGVGEEAPETIKK
jgi:hypothetical protein